MVLNGNKNYFDNFENQYGIKALKVSLMKLWKSYFGLFHEENRIATIRLQRKLSKRAYKDIGMPDSLSNLK